MADKIKKYLEQEVELISSGGGVFEVSDGDELIYSKRKTGAFPEEEDIIKELKSRM